MLTAFCMSARLTGARLIDQAHHCDGQHAPAQEQAQPDDQLDRLGPVRGDHPVIPAFRDNLVMAQRQQEDREMPEDQQPTPPPLLPQPRRKPRQPRNREPLRAVDSALPFHQPTDPSSEIATSCCASMSNSIGSACSTSRQKPLTTSATASSSSIPRERQ